MKKSPLILAGCGCASLVLSAVLFASAFFLFRDAAVGRSGDETAVYRNVREGRTGPLAENYVDFEIRYPKTWAVKPAEADSVNFVSLERAVDGNTWENLNVGYFGTAGSREGNERLYPQLIAQLHQQFARQYSNFRKVGEGRTTVGRYEAYEGLFVSDAEGAEIYTRMILVPTPDGREGVALLLMGTSHAPELESPQDLGTKGELPVILESFRFE